MAFCHRERAQNSEDSKCAIKAAMHNCADGSDLPAPTRTPVAPVPAPMPAGIVPKTCKLQRCLHRPRRYRERAGGGGGGGFVAKSCPTTATPWTEACQAPLSMEFSRQEHWSGLPFPSPGGERVSHSYKHNCHKIFVLHI